MAATAVLPASASARGTRGIDADVAVTHDALLVDGGAGPCDRSGGPPRLRLLDVGNRAVAVGLADRLADLFAPISGDDEDLDVVCGAEDIPRAFCY